MEKKEAICLVCLRECKLRCIALQDTIPLDGDKELVSYAEAYTNCTQLDVNVCFYELPEWLCNSCSCDLRCAYDFRIKAKESFEKLSKQIGINKPKQKDVEAAPGPYEFSWVDDNNETEKDINTDVDLLETCSDEDIADDEDPLENNINNNVVKENLDSINKRLQSPDSVSLDNAKSSKQVTTSLSDETGLKTETTLTVIQPSTYTLGHPPTPKTFSSVSAASTTTTDKNDVNSIGEFDVIENNQSCTEFSNHPFSFDDNVAFTEQKDSTNEGNTDSTLSPETQLFSKGQKKCSICEHSYFTTSGLNAHMEVHQVKANYSLVRKPYRKPLRPRTETEVFDADLNSDTENKQDSVTNIERSAENEETKVHKKGRKKSKAPKPKEPQSTQPKPKPPKSEQTTAKQIWACKLCAKSYTSKHSLNHHMRTHTGERPFECTICGDRFICNSTLKTHQRRHTGERPYACEECGKRFIQHSSMMAHVKLNHMDKTLQCPHCIKKYARKLDLEAHLLSHTGYKGFKCYLCPTGFVRQSNLEKHLRNVHPNEADSANMGDDNANQDGTENTKNRPYLCDLCPSRFTQQSVLSKHINQVHAKEPDRANKEDTISNESS